jgi:5'(3')-deoxyribonucleotidase
MSKIKLMIDMDETLANFLGSEELKDWDGHIDPPAMYEAGFFRNLFPLPGAKKAIYTLLQEGEYEIYILTKPVAKSADSYKEKVEWIASHFPDLVGRIIMTQNKHMVKGDILIDDDKSWKDWDGEYVHFNRKIDSAIAWERITNRLLDKKFIENFKNKGVVSE